MKESILYVRVAPPVENTFDCDQLKQSLYLWNSRMLFVGRSIEASAHKHHAVQISIGLDKPFRLKVDGIWKECSAVIVDKDQLHELDGLDNRQLLMLIDAETDECRQIRRRLLINSKIRKFSFEPDEKCMQLFECLHDKASCHLAETIFQSIIHQILGKPKESACIEPRIQEVISILDRMPEKTVSVGYLASCVYLSESRLIHLFKTQVGIPIRSYILWSRLMEAIKLIAKGVQFTAAAHQAGFTDSAHLCRVFKQMFGMRLSDLFKNSKYVQLFILPE